MEGLVTIHNFQKEPSVAEEYAYIIKGGTVLWCHSLVSYSGAVIPMTMYFVCILYHGGK